MNHNELFIEHKLIKWNNYLMRYIHYKVLNMKEIGAVTEVSIE